MGAEVLCSHRSHAGENRAIKTSGLLGTPIGSGHSGGIFALRAHCALLLDYVPPEEPPRTPLGNALRVR